MKVYVVTDCYWHDDQEIVGVFATKEAAEKWIDEQPKKFELWTVGTMDDALHDELLMQAGVAPPDRTRLAEVHYLVIDEYEVQQ